MRTHRPAERVVASLAAVAVGLTGLAWSIIEPAPAGAATHASTRTITPVSTAAYGRLMLVLDSSGSMAEPAGDGRTKIQDAKQALRGVIGDLPSGASVGLRVFGASVFSRHDSGACTDTQLAVPPATGNRDALRSAVAAYKPYGETPIPAALRAAAKDLGTEGKRSIVLVSDGESTCSPSPCKVSAEIARSGIDVQIDVVGLSVKGTARNQLRCIAEHGHGTYYDAKNARELSDSLRRSAARAAEPFTAEGTAVRGTPSTSSAPTIGAGAWLDHTPSEGQPRYYLIKRQVPGSTIRAGIASQPGDHAQNLSVDLLTAEDQENCGRGYGYKGGSSWEAKELVLAGAQSTDAPDAPYYDECHRTDGLLLKVTANSTSEPGPATPMQIVVSEEPPVSDTSSLPPKVDDKTDLRWEQMPTTGKVHPTTYGTSFSTAPGLTDGIFRASIAPGEVQLYRVHLDWGQSLQSELRVPPYRRANGLSGMGLIRSTIVSPNRADVAAYIPLDDNGDPIAHTSSIIVSAYNEGIDRTKTAPIRYLNRDHYSSWASPASIAGDYYVMVTLSPDAKGNSYVVPFDLVIKRTGTAGTGKPTYVEGGLHTGPTATPSAEPSDSGDPTPSATPDDSPSTEATSTTARGGSDNDGDQDSRDSGDTMLVAAGAGGLGVLILGGAALILLLRRPPRRR